MKRIFIFAIVFVFLFVFAVPFASAASGVCEFNESNGVLIYPGIMKPGVYTIEPFRAYTEGMAIDFCEFTDLVVGYDSYFTYQGSQYPACFLTVSFSIYMNGSFVQSKSGDIVVFTDSLNNTTCVAFLYDGNLASADPAFQHVVFSLKESDGTLLGAVSNSLPVLLSWLNLVIVAFFNGPLVALLPVFVVTTAIAVTFVFFYFIKKNRR